MMSSSRFLSHSLGCVLLLLGLAGCAAEYRAHSDAGADSALPLSYRSGFFESYAGLEPVGERVGLFIYVNPDVDFAAYDKLILGRIHLWRGNDHEEVPLVELESLAHRIHEALSLGLGSHYELVERSGPSTMRLSFGFTQAPEDKLAMQCYHTDVAATAVDRVPTSLSRQAIDFVEGAVAEAELTDSRTGEVLATLLDRRLEANAEGMRAEDWPEVDAALRRTARRFKGALLRLHKR